MPRFKITTSIKLAITTCAALASFPASALDLNSFRAQHRLPPLSVSATLSGEAYADAYDLANRNRLDHQAFRARARVLASTAAQNVLVVNCARPDAKPVPTFAGRACGGCDTEDCAIRKWAASPGH